MERNLSYWKGEKVFWRQCIAAVEKNATYRQLIQKFYRQASRKVEQVERKILVRHI